ncbi:MAG: hypothetical protein ACRET2_16515 [Steroidobacteraceae bacterium]
MCTVSTSAPPRTCGDWRSIELDNEHKPARTGCLLRVEHFGLRSVLERADEAFRASDDARTVERTAFDLKPVSDTERAKWPATLDERMSSLRPLINSGRVVRYGRGLGRYNWRARRINHLSEQLRQHRPGDATSAGELLQAFVLGVLLGTTRSSSFFDVMARMEEADERKARGEPHPALSGPFAYIQGRRPR